jgi:glutamine synthetase
VHRRAALLRAAIATSGNDHRLGANEAPPAIISVYLGEQLNRILDQIEHNVEAPGETQERVMRFGLSNLPDIERDATDRNRTSPFAFTGNKFEFRAVGSSASIAHPIMILNAAVAEALHETRDRIRAATERGMPFDQAAMQVVRELVTETRAVRFEGNNYSEEWVAEAERRGLPHLRRAPEALDQLVRTDCIELFTRTGTLSVEEVKARYHVDLERYLKDIDIEVETLVDLVRTHVLPAALQHQARVAQSLVAVQQVRGQVPGSQTALLDACTEEIGRLRERADALEQQLRDLGRLDEHSRAPRYAYDVAPAMQAVRESCDRLEVLVQDELWPLPKYHEMLFLS